MAKDTWNFPCWTTRDKGPGETRNTTGNIFELGPGTIFAPGTTLPFTTEITAIFSVLIRSGWTSTDGATQGIASVGKRSAADSSFRMSTNDNASSGGRPAINIVGWNEAAATVRYDIHLGDENGTDYMWFDKWYQIAVSINASGIVYAVNGTNTPKRLIATDNPGVIDMDGGSPRAWMLGAFANNSQASTATVLIGWPSMIFGSSAYYSEYIDLTDSAVLNRIYDSNGDFRNPGENGSLWFGDTYGETIPDWYFTDGTPIHQKGSDTQEWAGVAGGGAGFSSCPGGLRKQYEPVITAQWQYIDLEAAEASGDPWVDGDEIYTSGGPDWVYVLASAVSGRSGLMHKDPFNEGDSLSAVVVNINETASDPDTWAYTDGSANPAAKGTGYDYDTNGGKARLWQRPVAGVDNFVLRSDYAVATDDTHSFLIIDNADYIYVSGASDQFKCVLRSRALDDLSTYNTSLQYRPSVSTTNYTLWDGSTGNDTGIALATEQRIWIYAKESKAVIWVDDNKLPDFTTTVRATTGGTQLVHFQSDTDGQGFDFELGVHVVGRMTIS